MTVYQPSFMRPITYVCHNIGFWRTHSMICTEFPSSPTMNYFVRPHHRMYLYQGHLLGLVDRLLHTHMNGELVILLYFTIEQTIAELVQLFNDVRCSLWFELTTCAKDEFVEDSHRQSTTRDDWRYWDATNHHDIVFSLIYWCTASFSFFFMCSHRKWGPKKWPDEPFCSSPITYRIWLEENTLRMGEHSACLG